VTKELAFAVLISVTVCGQPPVMTQRTTVPIPRDFSFQRLPRFGHGFLLAFDFDRSIIWSYDRTGKQSMEVPLTIPNASRIQIRNISAGPDGTVAVTGSASDDQGRLTPVIFWIAPSGTLTRVVRTAPFSASQIAFADDGSLWAAGRAMVYNPTSPLPSEVITTAANFDVLRHYDAQGRLQKTALSRNTFASGAADPAMQSFLAVGKDRIGFLSVSANEYTELSLNGDVLGRWRIKSKLPEIVGFALTPSGSVFVSLRPGAYKSGKPYAGPPVLQLDKAAGVLQPVQLATDGPTVPTLLLGSDGDELAFYSKPPAAVSWFTLK
jgi:hypothetical protein